MKIVIASGALVALACLAVPAAAQEEQPRTTWRISLVNVTDDAGTRWEDLMMQTVMPAYEAAGLPVPQLHWTVLNDYEYVVISQIPGGMATFDHHQPAAREALDAALEARLGSEAAVEAMWAELNGYVEDSEMLLSHTHP